MGKQRVPGKVETTDVTGYEDHSISMGLRFMDNRDVTFHNLQCVLEEAGRMPRRNDQVDKIPRARAKNRFHTCDDLHIRSFRTQHLANVALDVRAVG